MTYGPTGVPTYGTDANGNRPGTSGYDGSTNPYDNTYAGPNGGAGTEGVQGSGSPNILDPNYNPGYYNGTSPFDFYNGQSPPDTSGTST